MNLEASLARYAELIVVHGLNVQPDQLVNIATEAAHRDFAVLVAEQCYQHGAKHVNLELSDPRLLKVRIDGSSEESLSYVSPSFTMAYDEMVDEQGANLKLIGMEDPDVYEEVDPSKLNKVQQSRMLAQKRFRDEGIMKSGVQWCVAAAATPKWGKQIFPDLDEAVAGARLWEEILKICRADKENCLQLWHEHNDALHKRAAMLTELKVRELHFTGPGTDLTVGLSEKAIFMGGQSECARGVPFEPNLPTEEVFTTPDYRSTNGHARVTRPFMIFGRMIRDLTLVFEDGVITEFDASEGADIFKEYIGTDEGAMRLGEVALVGVDSPIFESGLVFNEILFDENAACHIAVGKAYRFCIEDGETMSEDVAASIGCNDSVVHTDMMISSEEVSVTASTFGGDEVPIIVNGVWSSNYR